MNLKTLFSAASLAVLAATPALAGKADDTFTWTTSTEMDTPDIYYGNQREALITTYAQCDSLIHRDPITNEYEPLLATSWEWTDDTTLELKLREGVKFHDGTDFDAEDVAYTLNHVAAPDSDMKLRVIVDWIDNVEAVDPLTVRIHAKGPTPAAFEYLTGTAPIFPSGHYDSAPEVPGADGTRRDWGAVVPVCTGPYKLTDYQPGQSLTLEINEDYFDGSPKGKPTIGKIVYRTIKDPETQMAELVTGGVDWIWGVPPENADMLGSMDNITVESAATMRMSFLALDAAGRTGADNPFTDKRVRQAVGYAIDREAIAKNLVGPGAKVQESMCVPVQAGCATDVTQYEYNPDKARELLAEAGYEGGFSTPFYAYRDRPYTEAVLNYLRDVGIETDLNFLQWRALRPLIVDDKTPIAHLTFGSNGMLDTSASTGHYFQGSSDDYARDPDVMEWLAAAETETDTAERNALYAKALGKIADEAYYIPLYVYGRTYAFNSEFEYPITDDEMAHFYLGNWK
ncbi:ABC transporter substrate-binding protein [Acuticoccus sp. I52.16.1]|uniref:ABC transporter substrate-binding protein n=1 Tax=Acuticoccus sp. I52.16.1 TaxID=2928472 RepID=UPI001FD17840|nr:ABC transporter substrate-binding protein [Acuticoccus sp. I52.16.1]UOM34389.1 ABC transporter substrate-binding protein [Acuticoccus sp. I52.16.1]